MNLKGGGGMDKQISSTDDSLKSIHQINISLNAKDNPLGQRLKGKQSNGRTCIIYTRLQEIGWNSNAPWAILHLIRSFLNVIAHNQAATFLFRVKVFILFLLFLLGPSCRVSLNTRRKRQTNTRQEARQMPLQIGAMKNTTKSLKVSSESTRPKSSL